jgi:uncharacterized membrane protein YhaH (DUF805 family)
MEWYLTVLRKYADFSGRARRKEYWMFFLVNLLIAIVLGMVEGILGPFSSSNHSVLANLYNLAVLIPSLAVGARRLHDTGRSGWWLLIALIPVLGVLVLLVFFAQDGDPNPNEYGPNPKASGGTLQEATV